MSSFKEPLISYATERLSCVCDTPFAKYPTYLALRHPRNKKWAGVIMDLPARCVGAGGDEIIDVLNVKLDPLMVAGLRNQPGYAPAWHMSKEHWLSVRLDGSVDFDGICALLEMSYDLVGPKSRARQGEQK